MARAANGARSCPGRAGGTRRRCSSGSREPRRLIAAGGPSRGSPRRRAQIEDTQIRRSPHALRGEARTHRAAPKSPAANTRRRRPARRAGPAATACPSASTAARAEIDRRRASWSSAAARGPSAWSSSSAAAGPRRRRTTTAATASPHSASGMPITAASATAGWDTSTSSISPARCSPPPRTMTSSSRPSTKRKPSLVEPAGVPGAEPAILGQHRAPDVFAGHLLAAHPDLALLPGEHGVARRPPDLDLEGRGAGGPPTQAPARRGRRWRRPPGGRRG